MDLPRRGRETAHWPILVSPGGALEFDAYVNGAWVPTQNDGETVTLLLEGPDAPEHEATATVLPASARVDLRVSNITPEIIIRAPGWIRLVD